jgi:hypothetical protein
MLVARGGAMLKKLAGSYALAHHARVERQGMILSALSLSVSNMRRRRLRTALTLGTIALLVMSLVLFTSATSFQRDFERPSSMGSPPYAGIQVFNTYYHTHALAREQVELLEEALAGTSTVVRREYLNYGMKLVEPAKLYLRRAGGPAVPPGAVADADRLIESSRAAAGSGTREALVQVTERGLIVPSVQFVEPDEVKVTRVDSAAVVRGRWFHDSDVFACVVSTEAARCLGLDVGERASFEGFELEIVGLFDPERMDAIRDLDGLPWTPIQFSATQDEYDRPNHEPSAPVLYLPRRLNEETAYFPTAIWSVVIVPDDPERTSALARQLAREIRNVDVYESAGDRVSVHSAHATITVSGAAFLIGPLVITFFMILNIMLGTVYERTREINIFSSVGLSPAHVALMFLTESVVYAAVASVLGYFAGITLLTLFMRLGWLPAAFYPNYLGVVVIYATALAAAATVTSSIYPMMIASRIVNPSLARTWRIDSEPEGARWRIHFPFITHSRDEALGIMAFLAEFVEHNSGEAKGCFTAEGGAEFRSRAPAPARPGEAAFEERMELVFSAWLAPFERNVTQRAVFAAELDGAKRRWHFAFELERTSGEDYLWRKSNRYFLDLFRKQMLLWRSLDDRVVADYAGRGRALASPAEAAIKAEA